MHICNVGLWKVYNLLKKKGINVLICMIISGIYTYYRSKAPVIHRFAKPYQFYSENIQQHMTLSIPFKTGLLKKK